MKNKFTFLSLLFFSFLSASNLKAADISGKALYQGDASRPIGYVTVELRDANNNLVQTYKTGADGVYLFTNLAKGIYTVSGSTSITGGGVTYYDAAMVLLNLMGACQLTPIQELAADVNGNGKIGKDDYHLIINHILRNTPFPIGPWRFEALTITISDLKDVQPIGLGGTCSGDVGGTFVPTSNSTPALPVAQEGILNVADGEAFTTRILTHNALSIKGAGLIINYPSELLQIESVEFKGEGYEYNIENGQIRLVWGNPDMAPIDFNDGEALITIHGKGAPAFQEGMTASISLDGNTSLMNASNKEETNLNFASPLIKFGKSSLKLSNYPNPFKNSTKLSIYSPEKGTAVIDVYSANGQLVKNISAGVLDAGYQEVNLDASQLAKGNYLCKVRIQSKSKEYTNTIRLMKAE